MNRTFVISVVVLFVVSMALGFIVHGTLLHNDYTKIQGAFRSPQEAEALALGMPFAHLLVAIGFTWIYRHGRDPARPWLGQGVRFGLAVAVLATIPNFLISYVVTPMPSDVVAKQVVFGTIAMVVMGIVAAFVNRDYDAARVRGPIAARA